MSNAKVLKLRIVTQEQELLETEVVSVTAVTESGEVTILPGHIPLFSTLSTGELHYILPENKKIEYLAVSGGFLDVSPEGVVTILAHHARQAHEINEAEAEAARQRAEEAMREHASERDFKVAEMELLRAINELNIARRRKGGRGGL